MPLAVDRVHEDSSEEFAGIHRLRCRMGGQALPTGNRLGFLWVVLPPDRNRRQPHDRAVSSRTVASAALPGIMMSPERRAIRDPLDNQPVFISTPRTGGSPDGATLSDPSCGRSPEE